MTETTPDLARIRITIDVQGPYPHLYRLTHALSDPKGRLWLRNVLAGALERLLLWATGSDCWRLQVLGGSVGEIEKVEV